MQWMQQAFSNGEAGKEGGGRGRGRTIERDIYIKGDGGGGGVGEERYDTGLSERIFQEWT